MRLLRGAALRAELRRIVEAPVTELPAPEDGWHREKLRANAARGRQAKAERSRAAAGDAPGIPPGRKGKYQ